MVAIPGVEGEVEVGGGGNEAKVGEGLREIPQLFSRMGHFFRIQSKMIGISEHFFENQPGFRQSPSPSEGFDEPECAHAKGALFTFQTIGGGFADLIPIDQTT